LPPVIDCAGLGQSPPAPFFVFNLPSHAKSLPDTPGVRGDFGFLSIAISEKTFGNRYRFNRLILQASS
ncbi:MAG: hypothetical protein WC443_07845, partial [Desulfobaccales bacterium]